MCKKFLQNSFPALIIAGLIMMSVLSGTKAFGQTYIFPGSNPTYTGGANSWPFNASPSSGSNMCQWLYLNSDFTTTPPSGVNITNIYVKPTNSVTFTFTNLIIKMGNTTLTTLTSGTWNSPLTTVYAPSSLTVTTTANGWWQFSLPTPFYYTGGGILLEISNQGSSSSGITLNQFTVSGRNGRMYGSSTSSSSSGADGATACFGFDAAPANCSGTPLVPSITTTPFTAAAPLCAGTTTVLTATDPNLPVNGMAYQWQIGSSSTGPWSNVTNGSGATSLVYTTGIVPSTTWYRIGAICTNSNITSYSAGFQVLTGAAQPGVISGNSLFCNGDTATYSVPNVVGSTYSWTLPAGWSGFSTSNSILVTPSGTAGGTISVIATNSCGTSVARTRAITLGSAPGVPGTISGNNFICSGTTQTYAVTSVPGATYYTWSLPSGWSGSSIIPSITTTTNTTGGTVSIRAVNGCGPSSSASNLPVSIITTLANPGTITGSDTVCSGTLQTYSIAQVPGATGYTWSFPNGWSGTTTGTSIQAFPGTTSGNIQVTASVSCALSPVSQKPIYSITTLTPTISISSTASTLCQGTPIAFTASITNGGTAPAYQWQKNGVNVTGTGNTYTDNLLKTGDIIKASVTSNLRCTSTATVTSNSITTTVTPSVTPGISINTTPVFSICKGTPLTLTTTSNGLGNTTTYAWFLNGVQITGQTGTSYVSSTFNDKDTVTIQMTTNPICATSNSVLSNKVGITVIDAVVPSVSITASTNLVTLGDYITFNSSSSGGGSTPTYQWVKNSMDVAGETNTSYTSNQISPGDVISVKMLSYASCATPALVKSNDIAMVSAVGVGNVKGWDGSVRLYPNPNTGKFTVSATSAGNHAGQAIQIEVLNAIGQSVFHQELTPGKANWEYEINLPVSTANGRYLLRLSSDDMRATMPFVLNR